MSSQQVLMMTPTSVTRPRFFPNPGTHKSNMKTTSGAATNGNNNNNNTSLPPVKLGVNNNGFHNSKTSITNSRTNQQSLNNSTTPILPTGVAKKRRSPYHSNRIPNVNTGNGNGRRNNTATVAQVVEVNNNNNNNNGGFIFNVDDSFPSLPEQAPQDRGKLTLVLDVDETLVHSKLSGYMEDFRQDEERKSNVGACDEFQIILKDGEKVWVNKRPGLDKFLSEMSEHHEIIAYTAGLEEYARPLLDWIDPEKKFFRHRLYRDACVFQRGYYVKDLQRVNRDLAQCVLVDNNAMCFLPQLSNGIPISSFYDDPNDTALSVLASFLARLRGEKDVRPFLNRSFNLENLLKDHREQIIGC